jgi:hypothetical protein
MHPARLSCARRSCQFDRAVSTSDVAGGAHVGCYVFLLMGRCVRADETFLWVVSHRGLVTKQLSIAISICIGSGLAWSDVKMFAAAPASETRIAFD